MGQTVICVLIRRKKPCLNNKGYAKVSYGYDEWGNVTEILFLGWMENHVPIRVEGPVCDEV